MSGVVLVTGCSTGIGRETARRFLDDGWTVYAGARDPAAIHDLEDDGCRAVELDVTDSADVETATNRIFEEQGRLDCLVNNAGYGQFGAVEDVPVEKVIEQFDVNTFGPLRLVRAVLPHMRERGRGTIVNVGAGVGGLTAPGIGVYTGSKFALHSVSDALRQEVSDRGPDVVVVEPGIVATDFYDRALAEIASIDHTSAYAGLYRVLDDIGVVQRGGPGVNSPGRVAETIVEAASARRPDPVYRVGLAATLGTYAGVAVRGRLRDAMSRAAVGLLSRDWVQRRLESRR